MRLTIVLLVATVLSSFTLSKAQDVWGMRVGGIGSGNYYGITVPNGMIGIVSSPCPLEIGEVILAGVYDHYGRGRTFYFLPGFNLLDMKSLIGMKKVEASGISNFRQEQDMRTNNFTGSFDFKDMASEKNNHFYYNEINLPHTYIPLLTSTAKSPSGSITMVASNTFLLKEEHGNQPQVSHEMRNSDPHLMKFIKRLKKDEPYSFSLSGSLISSGHADNPYNYADESTRRLKMAMFSHWRELEIKGVDKEKRQSPS